MENKPANANAIPEGSFTGLESLSGLSPAVLADNKLTEGVSVMVDVKMVASDRAEYRLSVPSKGLNPNGLMAKSITESKCTGI